MSRASPTGNDQPTHRLVWPPEVHRPAYAHQAPVQDGGKEARAGSVEPNWATLPLSLGPPGNIWIGTTTLSRNYLHHPDAVSRSDVRRVLLDASSLPGAPPVITALAHNEDVAARKELQGTKFAVVFSSLGRNERTLETTGVNRGVIMRCITSREDAVAWLIG